MIGTETRWGDGTLEKIELTCGCRWLRSKGPGGFAFTRGAKCWTDHDREKVWAAAVNP